MWIRNTSPYPDDEVRELVRLGCGRIDMRDVCVNVKGGRAWKGRAYGYIPSISNAPPTALYLVTMHLPKPFEPVTWMEQRGPRWPLYRVDDWREGCVALAAHEARHIEQFKEGQRRSEVKCERYARLMLAEYRTKVRADAQADPDLVTT